MCAWLLKGGSWNCYSAGKVPTCAWLFGVHIQKVVGVPYIYSSIAYDSRRGCGIVCVQWGGVTARTRKNKTSEQLISVIVKACQFS